MPEHWCEKGHFGYLIEGTMEIEFKNSKVTYSEGDGIFLPNGSEHKHKGRVITDKVIVFFVENI